MKATDASALKLPVKLTCLLLGCTALVALPARVQAQDLTTEEAPEAIAPVATEVAGEDESFRLSPITVNAGVIADDDANSLVAQELWVGGKVATSILDTPASVSVITGKEIEERNATTVEEVLSYTPGVITDFYGSDDRNDYFQIRGYQATTYRDGMTLGSMRGTREEPFAYERVEVIRGANSTLFGPADPGGSVNYVTKRPRFERFGEASLAYGSFDTTEVTADFGDVLNAEGTLAYRFTGKVKNGGLDYDHSKDDETFLMGGVTWEPSAATSVSLVFDYLERDGTPNSGGYPLDREYDRSDFFGEPDFNYHDVERSTVTAMVRHEFDSGLTLNANLRYSDQTDDFGYIYLTDFAGRTGTVVDRDYFGTDSAAEELIGNAMLQYDTYIGTVESSTLVGIEYRDASTSSSSIYGDADPIDVANPVYSGAPSSLYVYSEDASDYTTKSVFLQQNFSFDDRFVATIGARHDWMDLASKGSSWGAAYDNADSFSESSFRAALTYKVSDEISAYASYVESVAPPSIGVKPERGDQYEFGVKYAPTALNALFTASVYDLNKKDVTIAVVQPGGTIERETIGETRVRGFELEGRAEVTENLSLIGSFSYMDSEVVRGTLRNGSDISGNEFTTTPNQMASLWLNYTLPGSGAIGDMSFGLGARYTGSYYFDAVNSAKSDSATLFDAAFTYEVVEGTEIALNINNLFDEQHVVGSGTADYYNPGRRVTATLRHSW